MKISVVIGKNEYGRGRSFRHLNDASFYIKHHLKLAEGFLIDCEPKDENELIRYVYKTDLGKKTYFILKVVH